MRAVIVLIFINVVVSINFSRFRGTRGIQNGHGVSSLRGVPAFHPYLAKTPYKRSVPAFHPFLTRPPYKRSLNSFRSSHGRSERGFTGTDKRDPYNDYNAYTSPRHPHSGTGDVPGVALNSLNLPEHPEKRRENIKEVTECMTVATMSNAKEETWYFRSKGDEETCGLYIVGEPSTMIEVTILELDVECSNGLVMVFDGWELNGNVFPSPLDHEQPLEDRSTTHCNQQKSQQVFVSGQNAALVSYKIPSPGQGFKVQIKAVNNPDPCNILMSDLFGYFTLQNQGKARNCSLTTLLFPANFALLALDVGEPHRAKRGQDSVQTQCSEHGWVDYIELGGSTELESDHLLTSETICGYKSQPIEKGLTVLCGSSTVRLVSSGTFHNSVSVYVKAASDEDLDFDRNMVISCPI